MKKLFFLSALAFLFLLGEASAQQPKAFSLEQAQNYASENNADLKNAFTDIDIAKKRVNENTAIGLPQVSGSIEYTDFLNIPTTLIPGEFFGVPGTYAPVKFGTEYNAAIKAGVSQLLYSGQYLVGLQTANAFLETAKQKFVQQKMDIRDQVSESYIGVLILEESIRILDSTEKNLASMVREAEASHAQGLIEDIDVDQLRLNLSNIESSIVTTRNQRVLAYNFLKFLVGLKGNEEMQLTDNLDYFLNAVNHDILLNTPFDYNQNISYKVFDRQAYLVNMQYKLSKTAYQPTLVAFLSTSYNAQRTNWTFFDTSEPWYNTTNWGVQLNIPIWSSGSRKYSVDQAKLQVKKMQVAREQLQTSLDLQAQTRKNDFDKAFLVFGNKKQALQTSDKIYKVTSTKYRQGVASSTDLNQKYSQFIMAQSDYTQALLDLLRARIKLSSLLEKAQ
jgi:outer membrane protein TolC